MILKILAFLYVTMVSRYLPAWYVGRLYQKHNQPIPELGSRLLPFDMILILGGLVTGMFFGVIYAIATRVLHTPAEFRDMSWPTFIAWAVPVFVFWVAVSLWMWKAWITRWNLGFNVLWPAVFVMIAGVVSVIPIGLLLSWMIGS